MATVPEVSPASANLLPNETEAVGELRDGVERLARLVASAAEFAAALRVEADRVADAVERRQKLEALAARVVEEDRRN
jgi:hypothetical protein